MYKKGGANAFLVIIILILIGLVIYLTYKNRNKEKVVVENKEQTVNPSIMSSDDSLLAEAKTLYAKEFPDNVYPVENSSDTSRMQISDRIDVTGDGVPEFIINTAGGGATTDLFALFRIEDKKVVFAKMKGKSGEIVPVTFLAGAGGAGRYGSGYEMMSDKHAFSIYNYSIYGTPEDFCIATVYQWNTQTKLFEYNSALTPSAQAKVQKDCDQVKKSLGL